MALRTVTVKAAAGDYTTLAAAEAGEQGDLPALDRQLDIECHTVADTTQVTVDGWTTDATRYIRIYTDAAARHAGVWDTGKYRLSVSAEFAYPLDVREDYVRAEGLQVEQTHAAGLSSVYLRSSAGATSDLRLHTSLVRDGSSLSSDLDGSAVRIGGGAIGMRNCAVYAASQSAVRMDFSVSAPTLNADNCTFIGGADYGVSTDGSTSVLRNCYAHGTTNAYNGAGMTRTTCAHSSASVFAGSTASVAHSTANFTNVTAGSQDYHLPSGSALLDAGTDLSGTFTDDFDGTVRAAPFDIGADERAAAAGGQPAWKRFGGVAFAARGNPGVF